jgi:hypothetical protein
MHREIVSLGRDFVIMFRDQVDKHHINQKRRYAHDANENGKQFNMLVTPLD